MTEPFAERDGRELAVQMIHELLEAGDDACCIESEYRDVVPQTDAVTRYLAVLRERQSPALDAGFAAILTDALGCDPNPAEFYDSLIEAP